MLTHGLGVTEQLVDLMRSNLDAVTGLGAYTNTIQEQHKRRHYRPQSAFLGPIGALRMPYNTSQTSLHAAELSAEPPQFSVYKDRNGFAASTISKSYMRFISTHVMGVLQHHMRRKNFMIPTTIVSGDHFFKLLNCSFTLGGQRSFEAAYWLVNEHSEVIAVVRTQSKSLEEIRTLLQGVAARMRGLDLPRDKIGHFYSDSPAAEKRFLHSVFPSMSLDQSTAPTFHVLRFPSNHVVNHLITPADVYEYIPIFEADLTRLTAPGATHYVGMDTKWTFTRRGGERASSATQVVQLLTKTRSLVLHIVTTGVPNELPTFLGD